MSDYNQFVLAVNKIFEITAKMKQGWKDQDNINMADSIEESKTTVVEAAKLFNASAVGTTSTASATPTVAEENLTPPVTEQLSDNQQPEVGVLGE